jgi:Protein of unknown function (DUF4199)
MEETQDQPVSIYAHAGKFGAILGIISIVIFILFYVVDLSFMASFKFLGLVLIIGLGTVIYAGINYRSEIGGYLPYGQAFLHGIIVLAVSGLVSALFNIVMFTIIDPDLGSRLVDAIAENVESMMRNFGAPDAAIDEAIDKMKAEGPANYTVTGLLWSFVKGLPWYVGIAAITSLFVRKNQPIEM